MKRLPGSCTGALDKPPALLMLCRTLALHESTLPLLLEDPMIYPLLDCIGRGGGAIVEVTLEIVEKALDFGGGEIMRDRYFSAVIEQMAKRFSKIGDGR